MTKVSLVRLPDKTGIEVQEYAQERGLAFATAVRCIVVEHFKVKASDTMNKQTGREGFEV